MILELSPETEVVLTAAAQLRGVDIETFIEQVAQEVVQEWPSPVEETSRAQLSERKQAMIAWLDERIAATPTDPEGIREAQAELDELMQNLNRNRIESGEEPLLP